MAKRKKEKPQPAAASKEEFPLSDFQDLSKTGRVDPQAQEQVKPAVKSAQYSIEKVKIENDHHLNVTYGIIHIDGSHEYHPGVSHDHFMHQDLKSIFLKLRIHLAVLCDYIPVKQIKNIEAYSESLVEKFRVTTVTIKQGEGVVITGYRKTHRKKTVTLNTPFTLTEEDEKTAYRFLDDLNTILSELLEETEKYIRRTKVGEDPQGKLDLKDPVEDDTYSEEDI